MDHAFPGGDDDVQPVGDELPAVPASWSFWLGQLGATSVSYDKLHKVRISSIPPEIHSAHAGSHIALSAATGAVMGGLVALVAMGVAVRAHRKGRLAFKGSNAPVCGKATPKVTGT